MPEILFLLGLFLFFAVPILAIVLVIWLMRKNNKKKSHAPPLNPPTG